MSIAEQIKALRQQHGLSQSELGAIVGVTDKAVSTWETGLKEPRRATLEKLAAHFHVPVGQITGDSLDDGAIKFALAFVLDQIRLQKEGPEAAPAAE